MYSQMYTLSGHCNNLGPSSGYAIQPNLISNPA